MLTASASGATPVRIWWACLGALCLMLLAPLLLTDVPPLLDYPNHLARMVILAANGADPILARFYTPRWGIIPDLAIDAVTPMLLWVLPVHVAGRIMLGLVVLLPVLGTVAYSRAVLGRLTWWPLGCVLVAYNAALLQGFLNFTVGIGAALLLAAAWLRWREADPLRTLLLAIPGAVVLFFCHLMGLLFFALLIGAHELTHVPALLRRPGALFMRLVFAVPVFAVPVALYAYSHLSGMDGEPEYLSVTGKAAQLLIPFVNYSLPLDIATAVLVAGGLVVGVATRRLWMPARSAIALLLLTLLYLAAPFEFKGTYYLDSRFVVMLGFLLFGGMLPVALPRGGTWPIAAGMVVLFTVRMMVLGSAWLSHNHDLAQLRAVTAGVAPGSSVFVTTVTPEEAPDYWDRGQAARRLSNGFRTDPHLPALLLIERRAWWPFLFDNPSQQPMETNQPYEDLADRVGSMPPHNDLEIPGRVDLCGFDNVLLLQAGAVPNLDAYASDRLALVAAADAAALFRVRPDPACPSLSAGSRRGADGAWGGKFVGGRFDRHGILRKDRLREARIPDTAPTPRVSGAEPNWGTKSRAERRAIPSPPT